MPSVNFSVGLICVWLEVASWGDEATPFAERNSTADRQDPI